MGKIAIWVQRVLLRCFDQAKDYAAALSSIGCIGKEEVLPCYYKRLHGTFRSVVAGLQSAVCLKGSCKGISFGSADKSHLLLQVLVGFLAFCTLMNFFYEESLQKKRAKIL